MKKVRIIERTMPDGRVEFNLQYKNAAKYEETDK